MDLVPKQWTLGDWDKMIAAGLIGEDERLLLLEGEILHMSPQNSPHATALGLAQEALSAILPAATHLRVQLPLYLGPASDPEPDLAVVAGGRRDYAQEHPRTALLVVEVADSSLALDCGRKARLYARFGIPEYWVIDLKASCLHRFSEPHDTGYGLRETHAAAGSVRWEGHRISVADLLP